MKRKNSKGPLKKKFGTIQIVLGISGNKHIVINREQKKWKESSDDEQMGTFSCKMSDLKLMVTMLQDRTGDDWDNFLFFFFELLSKIYKENTTPQLLFVNIFFDLFVQEAQVIIDKNGMTFICEMDKSMQARVFIRFKMFDEFVLKDTEMMKTSLDLWNFLECIRVFAGSSILEMEINNRDTIKLMGYTTFFEMFVQIRLQDIPNQVVTRCFVRLFPFAHATQFFFPRGNIVNSCTMIVNSLCPLFILFNWLHLFVCGDGAGRQSQHLRDAFSELDALGKDDNIVSFRVVAGKTDEFINIDNDLELMEFPPNDQNDVLFHHDSTDNKVANPIDSERHADALLQRTDAQNVSKKPKFTISIECDSHTMEAEFPIISDIFQLHDFHETKVYQYRMRLLRTVLRSIKGAEKTRFFFGSNNMLRVEQTYAHKNMTALVAFLVNAVEIP
ncbi:hypothetical protein RFI_15812 [Reticulomyxa filosa]|uniref:Uncharacterized protein n=1 Tax=Reticulomyxa filosa TaxID=46433 RepID=X6N6P1_RETFI|nr:hypothetical protein RFI_15812 [Reticulomyxa filosa]|eukprot:ETO21394.1 hypothetical protein RFI_15812 [Reticulomyxa filosa]